MIQIAYSAALAQGDTDRRVDILRRVSQTGSISQAARDAGISYKAAWQALEILTNLAGVPLIERVVGGSGGGGASLSAAGQQLLQVAHEWERSRQQLLARLQTSEAGQQRSQLAWRGLSMRTSMRNQLACRLLDMHIRGALVQVQLALAEAPDQAPGGAYQLQARITRESAQLLDLEAGGMVLAMCKATAVRIRRQTADDGAPVNACAGRVLRVSSADTAQEVTLQLPGGQHLVGFAAADTGLRKGHKALAWFDPTAVVLAV